MDKWIKILVLLLAMGPKTKAQGDLWKALPFQVDYQTKVMYYDSMDQVSYIAGNFTKVNDTVCNIIQWDGSSYTLLPSSPLYTTNCLIRYHNKLYAGGHGLASWNGSSWTYLDSNAAVFCFYPYHGNLLIGGNFNNLGADTVGSLASWNDTTFSDVHRIDTLLGNTGWTVLAVREYKEQLYVAGNFSGLNNPLINEITRFDGQKWTDLDGQITGGSLAGVNDMEIWRDTLYVAGQFDESTGSPGNSVASWDGSQWRRLKGGVLPGLYDLNVYHDKLWATGIFYILDDVNLGTSGHKGVAQWDGSKWCTMGTTGDGGFTSTGQWKDSLYLLGGFHTINNDTMHFIAQWIGGDYTDTCFEGPLSMGVIEAGSGSISAYPNPSDGLYHIRLYNSTGSHMMNISVVDLLGHTLYNEERKFQPGDNDIDIDLKTAVPGMYLLHITSGTGRYAVKLQKE